MKKATLVLLIFACANVHAELPVVIDNSSYPVNTDAPVNTGNTSSSTALYELMARLEQMQTEVQQLTGKVDEQAFLIEELKKRQSKLYTDFDERLQSLENKGGANSQAVTGSISDASSSQVPTEAVVASPVVDTVVKPASVVSNDSVSIVNVPASADVSGSEKQEYASAYNELRTGHTPQSIELFKAYLTKYPASLYANNAQYWLAEAYRVQKDNEASYKAFTDVLEKYPNGAKVPDALLRLGMIEMERNNTTKAREYFTRITNEFSKSQVAPIAAKKMLKLDEVKN